MYYVKTLQTENNIQNRNKQGFSMPLGKWFREELSGYLKDIVLSSKALNRGYFNPESIKVLIDNHIEGKKDYGYCLWTLLMLELWHRVFIDGDMYMEYDNGSKIN